jgi:AcrR family transcriptional regulator
MGRKAQKAQTRRALKGAALRCCLEDGWSSTSIGSITRRAGVAHGTFYVHFPSKEALLEELLADFNDELAARLAPLWTDRPDPRDAPAFERLVRQTAELFLDHWSENQGFVEAYASRVVGDLTLADLRDGISPPMADLLVRSLGSLTAEPTSREAVPAFDVELAAHGLLALWLRVGLRHLFGDTGDRAAAVDCLVRMTLGAIRGLLDSADRG